MNTAPEKYPTAPTLARQDWYLALLLVVLTMLLGSWYMVAGVSGVFSTAG